MSYRDSGGVSVTVLFAWLDAGTRSPIRLFIVGGSLAHFSVARDMYKFLVTFVWWFIGYTAVAPVVVYLEVCVHEVP